MGFQDSILFHEVEIKTLPESMWTHAPGAHQDQQGPCAEMVNNSLAVLR